MLNAAGPEPNQYDGQAYTDPLKGKWGSLHDWKAGWVDTHNHNIKALLDPYLESFNGQIHLAEVLDVAGKHHQTDLPMLP